MWFHNNNYIEINLKWRDDENFKIKIKIFCIELKGSQIITLKWNKDNLALFYYKDTKIRI